MLIGTDSLWILANFLERAWLIAFFLSWLVVNDLDWKNKKTQRLIYFHILTKKWKKVWQNCWDIHFSYTIFSFILGKAELIVTKYWNNWVGSYYSNFVIEVEVFSIRKYITEDGKSTSVFSLYWQTSQGLMANFPAFIASKSFELWNHLIP